MIKYSSYSCIRAFPTPKVVLNFEPQICLAWCLSSWSLHRCSPVMWKLSLTQHAYVLSEKLKRKGHILKRIHLDCLPWDSFVTALMHSTSLNPFHSSRLLKPSLDRFFHARICANFFLLNFHPASGSSSSYESSGMSSSSMTSSSSSSSSSSMSSGMSMMGTGTSYSSYSSGGGAGIKLEKKH